MLLVLILLCLSVVYCEQVRLFYKDVNNPILVFKYGETCMTSFKWLGSERKRLGTPSLMTDYAYIGNQQMVRLNVCFKGRIYSKQGDMVFEETYLDEPCKEFSTKKRIDSGETLADPDAAVGITYHYNDSNCSMQTNRVRIEKTKETIQGYVSEFVERDISPFENEKYVALPRCFDFAVPCLIKLDECVFGFIAFKKDGKVYGQSYTDSECKTIRSDTGMKKINKNAFDGQTAVFEARFGEYQDPQVYEVSDVSVCRNRKEIRQTFFENGVAGDDISYAMDGKYFYRLNVCIEKSMYELDGNEVVKREYVDNGCGELYRTIGGGMNAYSGNYLYKSFQQLEEVVELTFDNGDCHGGVSKVVKVQGYPASLTASPKRIALSNRNGTYAYFTNFKNIKGEFASTGEWFVPLNTCIDKRIYFEENGIVFRKSFVDDKCLNTSHELTDAVVFPKAKAKEFQDDSSSSQGIRFSILALIICVFFSLF
jgi:hypothetical protein